MHQDKLQKKVNNNVEALLKAFQKRFIQLLETQKPVYWAEHTGISKSLITNRWKEGSFPRADNIIKILQLSGFSANWLLLGHGRRYLSETRSEQDIARTEHERRTIQEEIFELEEKYEAALGQIEQFKQQLALKQQTGWLAEILGPILDENTVHRTDTQQRFNESVLPVLNIVQSFLLLAFKLFETSAKSEDGGQRLIAALTWIRRNFEKNNYTLLSMLSELDTLRSNEGFARLFDPLEEQ